MLFELTELLFNQLGIIVLLAFFISKIVFFRTYILKDKKATLASSN